MRTIIMAVSAASALAFAAPPASAQTCETNAQCPKDWTCQVVSDLDCDATILPVSDPAGGVSAGDATKPVPADCKVREIKTCVAPPPAKCDASNQQCPDGLRCMLYTYDKCDAPPIAPCASDDAKACAPIDAKCTTVTDGLCVPPYFAPCKQDPDCGAGFKCVASEICSCGGGQSAGSAGAAAPNSTEPAVVPAECTCAPSAEKYCELQEQACGADKSCPEGLTCETYAAGGVASVCAVKGDATTSSDAGQPDCSQPVTPAPAEVSRCVPPTWMAWGGGWGLSAAAFNGPDGNGGSGGTSLSMAAQASQEVIARSLGLDATTSLKVAAPPTQLPADKDGDSASSGCAVASTRQDAGSALWLVLVGATLLARAARRRRA